MLLLLYMPLLPTVCPVCAASAFAYEADAAVCTHCKVYRLRLKWWQRIVVWTRGRIAWWRLLPFTVFGYLFLHLVQSHDLQRSNPIDLFDFGIHELGHILFVPLGTFMTILGGSLFQCLFPLLWLGAFWWKRWYFAASLCLCWLGINLFDVAVYVADARARLLPLATFSNDYDSAHDWYQILSRINHLEDDTAIAGVLRWVGGLSMVLGLVVAVALIGWMVYWQLRPAVADNSDSNEA